MKVDELLSRLQKVKKHSGYWMASCPAHDDRTPSLEISTGDEEKILLRCHAGCATEAVVESLGLKMSDLFQSSKRSKGQILTTYDYTDANGKLLYQAVRCEGKRFFQRRPDGNGWINSIKGVQRVLYHLPEVVATEPGSTIFICEGEKSTNAIRGLGLVATTNSGGAGNWVKDGNYNESLGERQIVILLDNDQEGKSHAQQITQVLLGIASGIRILNLMPSIHKSDPFDWVSNGGNREALLALVENTPVFQPETYEIQPALSDNELTWLPVGEIIAALNRGETGDAEMLAQLYTNRIAFDHTEKVWHLWRGHNWKRDQCGFVRNLVTNQIASQYLHAASIKRRGDNDEIVKSLSGAAFRLRQRNRISNVLTLANGLYSLALTGDEWGRNPWLLGVTNGTINLQAGSLSPGQPSDYIRDIAPTRWQDLEEPAPMWERFLIEIFAGDNELVSFVQRLLGYGITGHNHEHKLAVLYGEGRNGKDTLLEALIHVLGEMASPVGSEVLLSGGRNPNAATPHLYGLRPLRLAWVSETNEGARLDAGQVKLLTGGGTVVARPLYGSPIRFTPQYLMMLVTNFKPHASADDYALWKRLYLIPFTEAFVDNPDPDDSSEHLRDPYLAQTLKAEAGGILAWLVRGCLAWQVQGLNPPATVIEATEEYRQEEDTLSDFFDEYCEPDEEEKTKASNLYQGYATWAKKKMGSKPMSSTAFGKRAKKRFERKHFGDGNYYLNLKFIGDNLLDDALF